MVLCGHDSDLVQWGLRLLEGDSAFNSGYYGEMIQQDSHYRDQYYGDNYGTEPTYLVNDDIPQHDLEEKFSRLSVTEASGFSHTGDEESQTSLDVHDWHNSMYRDYSSEYGCVKEDSEAVDASSSCPSPGDGEDCTYYYDGEVGWRLNQLTTIPHIPRINGEIPSVDEATSDHQRLLDRLQVYDFTENKVQGDGNCQFRALSDQLYGSPDHHMAVRRKVVSQLEAHREIYEGYVPMAYGDYQERMSQTGEWGDHVTLQAAADSYGVRIFMITSFKDTCCIEIIPHCQKSKRVIFLSFWAEVHYNSICPREDVPLSADTPSSAIRKKRRWWMFGNKH